METYKIIIVVGMVVTGTINTISATLQLARQATGIDGEDRYFRHPYIQAMFMMAGETFCMAAYLIHKCITSRNSKGEQGDGGELPMNPLILFPASFMDLVGTALGYMGLAFSQDGGTFQMLRATAMIWCGLLSIPFLGRRLKWFQWFGMFVIACGLFLKASIMIPGMFDYEEPDFCIATLVKPIDNDTVHISTTVSPDDGKGGTDMTTIIGYLLIVVGEFLHGCQFVYEEKFVVKYNLAPLKIVGWEGIFGFITMGLLLWPLYFIKISNEDIATGPDGRFEDALDGFAQIFGGSLWLLMWTLGNMCSIACFNFAGVSVTKELSSVTRAVLDNLRIVFIWAFFLIPFGPYLCKVQGDFHYTAVIGLFVLICGIWIYNDIIILPTIRKLFCKKQEEEKVEKVEG